jgi:hypothetical protein
VSLLKPSGVMRIGLYSEIARAAVVEGRSLIASHGYPPTPEGIRALRSAIICDPVKRRWQTLLATATDFYGTSGCRDLFFNVMEHRFNIPQIGALLGDLGLTFLGFEVDPDVAAAFRARYPGTGASTNLRYWDEFECANPHTFRRMYVFTASRPAAAAR